MLNWITENDHKHVIRTGTSAFFSQNATQCLGKLIRFDVSFLLYRTAVCYHYCYSKPFSDNEAIAAVVLSDARLLVNELDLVHKPLSSSRDDAALRKKHTALWGASLQKS